MSIRKYKDFTNSTKPIKEELFGFGLTKAEKIEKRKINLQNSLDKYLPIWIRKRAIKTPTKFDLDKFWEDAESDDFQSGDIVGGSGGVGISNEKSLMYRNSSNIKTKGQPLEGVNENLEDHSEESRKFRDDMMEMDSWLDSQEDEDY